MQATPIEAAFNPFLPPDRDDPYPTLERARCDAPVFRSEAMGAWVVARHDDIRAVAEDPATFSNAESTRLIPAPPEAQAILDEGYGYDEMRPLLTQDPPRHTRVRKSMARALAQRVPGMEPRVRARARELIAALPAAGEADFVRVFCYPLPLTVILELQGIPPEDHDDLQRWSNDKVALQWGGAMSVEEHVAHARGYVEFQRYLTRLIEDRRASPRDDIVSELVQGHPDGDEVPLSTGEVVGQMMGLIAAGHETTANLIAMALFRLLRDGRWWEQLRADPGLAPAVVEESLRRDSSVLGVPRVATRDCEIGGVPISAGDRVFLMLGSGNLDEDHFADGATFDPQRQHGSKHLSFGHGIHFCIGATLARLEARVALQELAQSLPGLRLASDRPVEFLPNAAFRIVATLPLRWTDSQ